MPVAFETPWIIRKENHVALEYAYDEQQKYVGHENPKQKHR
jgi:hypothetical protein